QYLPDVSAHVTRPSKLAARAMAARIYLSMGDFEKAFDYVEAVLKERNELMDFRQLSPSVSYPITIFNKEVILHSYMQNSLQDIYVNKKLWESFEAEDLRKTFYFNSASDNKLNFRGSYYGRA